MPTSLLPSERRSFADDLEAAISFFDITDEIINAVASSLKPDQVFEEEQLCEWAENNGYTKSE